MSKISEVKKDIKKGIFFTFISRYSVVFFQLIISMVLARLLSPEEYGTIAIVSVFISFYSIIGEMGLGPSVIQKDLDNRELSTIAYLSIGIAVFFVIINIITSYITASIYDTDIYIVIFRLLSISLFCRVITMVPSAIIRKQKRFLALGICRLTAEILSSGLAIFLAVKGFSYFALVYKAIAKSVLELVFVFFVSKIKLELVFIKSAIKKVFSYSFFQFLGNTFNYFSRNIDTLIIGKIYGKEILGNYDKAYKLARYPINNLSNVITPVLHPVLAGHKNDKPLIYEVYTNMIKKLAFISITISVAGFFASKELILIIYGDKWINVVPIFQIFSISIATNVLLSTTGSIFQSLGRTGLLLVTNIIFAAAVVTAILIGFSYNIEAVTLCIVIAYIFVFLFNFIILIKFLLKESFIKFLFKLKGPFLLGVVLAGLYIGLSYIKIENLLIRLVIKSLIAGCGIIITWLYQRRLKTKKKKENFEQNQSKDIGE